MKQWYFDLAEFKPEVGFKFQFMGGTEDNQYHFEGLSFKISLDNC